MVAESRAACKEVWAPGYDHSPGQSDTEEHQSAAPKKPSGCQLTSCSPSVVS